MAKLTTLAKRMIVRELAWWTEPSLIPDIVERHFGKEQRPTPSQLSGFNPGNRQAKELSRELRELFETEREKAKKVTEDLWLAHQPARIKRTQLRIEALDRAGNYVAAQDIQGAGVKDLRGGFDNKMRIVGALGADGEDGPLEIVLRNE